MEPFVDSGLAHALMNIAPVFVSSQGRDIASVEKRPFLHHGNFIEANYPTRVDTGEFNFADFPLAGP